MANATDLVALAAIAVGAVGSSAVYSGVVGDRTTVVERNVVVRLTNPPPVHLEVEPPAPIVTVPGDLRVRHVPYVVYERRVRAENGPGGNVEARVRIRRNGPVMELREPEQPSRPDRKPKKKRRPGRP